ncbi:calcium/sodium antiporter [Halostella sp. JP-L12]|uniref:calcium/sodium antiporter n=1 Tax=Halostella TaxID=1843185 RepID=UPI000EF81835|nr:MULTISPECIES: calcium/sodium antiporter [Halostella]NHN46307.1 calcium/sodium antiporter [Halostella sp. JP-L12]
MALETAIRIGLLVASVAGLWVGARLLVDAVVRLGRRVGLSELTIGLTVVAAGTSTPELVVTTDAALKGLGDIAIGNVVGSNIYNLAFVLGVVSLIRFVPIERSLVHRDGLALIASTLVGAAVMLDLTVTRAEGALLLALFAAYTAHLLRSGAESDSEFPSAGEPSTREGTSVPMGPTDRVAFRGRDAVLLVAGLAITLVSGDVMVRTASALARGAGVSEWVIGGTVVAAGTSTPEFAVSLVAMRRGSLGVSVGNVVGSNVFNLLGVVGVASLIRPLSFGGAALESLAWLTAVSVAIVAALWTRRRLSRGEGALFAGSEIVRWTLGLLGGG